MNDQLQDRYFMKRALALAERGVGLVNPNPLVGAVLVKDGQILGEGWHRAFGLPHAEREALADCARRGVDPQGSTLYVTLEPCCHMGKQPPCTDAIIDSGIVRVVVGALDPNPCVAGKGIALLREAGIDVEENVCLDECMKINAAFFHYITTKMPYVTVKYAMTLDGKIATRTGKSRWITSEAARRRVHVDRQKNMGIMVGVNTIIQDDPVLTCRMEEFLEEGACNTCDATTEFIPQPKNPIRIICDTNLRTPLTSKVVKTASEVPTVIVTSVSDIARQMPYREADCDLVVVQKAGESLDLYDAMERLGAQGIDSILLEGGATLAWSAFSFEVVQALQVYLAPKVFGGAQAPSPVGGYGVDVPKHAFITTIPRVTYFGCDLLLECEVQ